MVLRVRDACTSTQTSCDTARAAPSRAGYMRRSHTLAQPALALYTYCGQLRRRRRPGDLQSFIERSTPRRRSARRVAAVSSVVRSSSARAPVRESSGVDPTSAESSRRCAVRRRHNHSSNERRSSLRLQVVYLSSSTLASTSQ